MILAGKTNTSDNIEKNSTHRRISIKYLLNRENSMIPYILVISCRIYLSSASFYLLSFVFCVLLCSVCIFLGHQLSKKISTSFLAYLSSHCSILYSPIWRLLARFLIIYFTKILHMRKWRGNTNFLATYFVCLTIQTFSDIIIFIEATCLQSLSRILEQALVPNSQYCLNMFLSFFPVYIYIYIQRWIEKARER